VRVAASFDQSLTAALADLERVDAGRAKIAKERYKIKWSDARAYDLALNVARVGVDGAVDLIVAAVRAADVPR
jgi:cytidylate kinase